jgi:hypothetical protein
MMHLRDRQRASNRHQGHLIFLERFEQQVDSLKRLGIEASHVLLGVGNVAKIEESEHKRIQHCKSMRSYPFANLTSILTESDIPTVMQAVFSGPVVAVQFEQAEGISLFGSEASDPVNDLLCTFESMFNTSA